MWRAISGRWPSCHPRYLCTRESLTFLKRARTACHAKLKFLRCMPAWSFLKTSAVYEYLSVCPASDVQVQFYPTSPVNEKGMTESLCPSAKNASIEQCAERCEAIIPPVPVRCSVWLMGMRGNAAGAVWLVLIPHSIGCYCEAHQGACFSVMQPFTRTLYPP